MYIFKNNNFPIRNCYPRHGPINDSLIYERSEGGVKKYRPEMSKSTV